MAHRFSVIAGLSVASYGREISRTVRYQSTRWLLMSRLTREAQVLSQRGAFFFISLETHTHTQSSEGDLFHAVWPIKSSHILADAGLSLLVQIICLSPLCALSLPNNQLYSDGALLIGLFLKSQLKYVG